MNLFLRFTGYLIAAGMIIASAGYAYRHTLKKAHPPPKTESRTPLPICVAPVQTGCVTNAIKLTGSLEAIRIVDVVSKISGRLERLALDDGTPVLEGTTVTRGQVLAVIDHRDIQARLDESRAAVETARAALETSLVVLKDRKRERDRMDKLFAEGSTTEQQRDLAATDYEQAVTGVTHAKAQLVQAEAATRVIEVTLSEAFIRAPMNGVVSIKYTDPGAMVNATTMIVRIIPMEELKFIVSVPGPYLHLLAVGKTVVSVVSDAVPDRIFTGLIARIYPAVDPVTRTATVEVRLTNAKNTTGEWLLRPGLYAEGRMILRVRENVVTLPADVALRRGDRLLAFVVNGNTAERRDLRAGIRDGARLEIVEGLKVGEQVVVSGQHRLTDGYPVRRVDAAHPPRN